MSHDAKRIERLRQEIASLRQENRVLKRQLQEYDDWRINAIALVQNYVDARYVYDNPQPQTNILDVKTTKPPTDYPVDPTPIKKGRLAEMHEAFGFSAKTKKSDFQPTTLWANEITKNSPNRAHSIPKPVDLPASQPIPKLSDEVDLDTPASQSIPKQEKKERNSPTRSLKQSRLPKFSPSNLFSLIHK